MLSRVLALALVAASTLPAQAAESEAAVVGWGIAYVQYLNTYNSRSGSFTSHSVRVQWRQAQVLAFVDTRGFAIGSVRSRWRFEARIGRGGATDEGSSSAAVVSTEGGASVGFGASLRMPVVPGGKGYVGLGFDLSQLFAFGNSGSGYDGDGWSELLSVVPVVVGMRLTLGGWVVRPEVRYIAFGWAMTNLEPQLSATLVGTDPPRGFAVVVSLSRLKD